MNFWLKVAAASALAGLVTVAPKFLLAQDASATNRETDNKAARLHAFLAGEHPGTLAAFRIKKTTWRGWQVKQGRCDIRAIAAVPLYDGAQQFMAEQPPGTVLRYVYRGDIRKSIPIVALSVDFVRMRLAAVFSGSTRWRTPLFIFVAAPPSCRSYYAWHWSRLWQ